MRKFIVKSIGCLALGLAGSSAFALDCSLVNPTFGEVCLKTSNHAISATAKGFATSGLHGTLQLAVYQCPDPWCVSGHKLIANSPSYTASKAPAVIYAPGAGTSVVVTGSHYYLAQFFYNGVNVVESKPARVN